MPDITFKDMEKERQKKGVTIKQLCEDLPINQSTYHRWLSGKCVPKVLYLNALKTYLQMQGDVLQ